jgi:hypothetical protein
MEKLYIVRLLRADTCNTITQFRLSRQHFVEALMLGVNGTKEERAAFFLQFDHPWIYDLLTIDRPVVLSLFTLYQRVGFSVGPASYGVGTSSAAAYEALSYVTLLDWEEITSS